MESPVIPKLDEVDLMLIKELEVDARQTNRALSEKLGVSAETVRKRLTTLLDEGIVRLITVIQPYALGYQAPVLLALNVSRGKTDEVADYLRPKRRILDISLATGRYDILAFAILPNIRDLPDFLDEQLSGTPHLIHAETILIMDMIKMSWKFLSSNVYQPRKTVRRDFDELDRRLIRELVAAPRERIIDLAKKLGTNRQLIGRRLQSLLADDVAEVISFIRPSALGLHVRVIILVRLQPGTVRSVANSLVAEQSVQQIHLIAGPFDLLLTAVFPDADALFCFLKNHLDSYPGVISHETMLQVSAEKYSVV